MGTPDPTESPVSSETSTTSSGRGGGGGGAKTPAPTHHSAKKWEMLNPNYKGGDGELLWNIYYGDFSDDERFDAFRADQLWDADVIRPIIEEDVKYERFQLANIAVNNPSKHSSDHWSGFMKLLFVGLMMLTAAALVFWCKCSENSKIGDSS